MQAHRLAEVFELAVAQFGYVPIEAQTDREVGGTQPVRGVAAIVVALAVVQEREPREHLWVDVEMPREPAPMHPNPAPVGEAVDTVGDTQSELRADDGQCLVDDSPAFHVFFRHECLPSLDSVR